MVTKQEQAEKDYMAGMKYKDIAEKYGTTINTVKSWKKRYAWSREGAHKNEKGCTQNKKSATTREVQIDDGTKETLQNDELTTEQKMFCIYYSNDHNAVQSYIKAYNCSYQNACGHAHQLLKNVEVRKEIDRLLELKAKNAKFSTDEMIELQMRIAFADIGNYLTFGQKEIHDDVTDDTYMVSTVDLKESDYTDTQLIKSVKRGKYGISIALEDRQKAIDWLTKYFNVNPMDKHKQEFDRQKMELELLKLEMQAKADGDTGDAVEDNFLEALNAAAKDVWSDE